jgi:hypothetical protein
MCNSDVKIAKRYLSTAESANSRNIEFDINFSDFKKIFKQTKCAYTNVEMDDVDGSPNQKTIDRVDASLGYTFNNMVCCTRRINSIKSNLTSSEIECMYKFICKRKIYE